MAGTTVTTRAKKKMLEARAGIAALPKIVGMAFGTGGVNSAGEIVVHSPDQNALHKEVLRKNIDGYAVVSDTKIRYSCTLTASELPVNIFPKLACMTHRATLLPLRHS